MEQVAGIILIEDLAKDGRSRNDHNPILKKWQHTPKSVWKKCLMNDVEALPEKGHGEVKYYLMQFLTGHSANKPIWEE